MHLHFALPFMTNSYLIAPGPSGPAVLIDPGAFDLGLLEMVENNGYYIRSILVTRPDRPSTDGIRTVLKIYDAQIYTAARRIDDFPCKTVAGGESFDLHGMSVEVLGAQAYSRDAVMFKVDNLLFTGDILTAGSVGKAGNPYGTALLAAELKERFRSLDDNTLVFPGSGPPSTLEAEKKFNSHLQISS